jgi:hypothetical protein
LENRLENAIYHEDFVFGTNLMSTKVGEITTRTMDREQKSRLIQSNSSNNGLMHEI